MGAEGKRGDAMGRDEMEAHSQGQMAYEGRGSERTGGEQIEQAGG